MRWRLWGEGEGRGRWRGWLELKAWEEDAEKKVRKKLRKKLNETKQQAGQEVLGAMSVLLKSFHGGDCFSLKCWCLE